MTTTVTSQPGLFAQLEPLLAYRAVLITVSKLDGDQLQVNICPRQLKEGENSALTIPLCVTGTAVELEADLVTQIARFVASHVGLNTNLAAIEKELAEAEKEAREDAKKKTQGRRQRRKEGNGQRYANSVAGLVEVRNGAATDARAVRPTVAPRCRRVDRGGRASCRTCRLRKERRM